LPAFRLRRPPPPRSTLFPYTTLFRSLEKHVAPVADIYAYCLLNNHFHLLIKTKYVENESLLSRSFSNFFNAYSKAINKSYNRSGDRKSTRLNSSHVKISYAVFCLKKK